MARIAPSILSADFAELGRALDLCASSGAELVHVDVMDGHFVPNLTIGPPVVAALKKRTRLPLDVHLMIERPLEWVDRYCEAGANRLSLHVEAEPHLRRAFARIREAGGSPGVAVNPATALASLDEALPYVDFVVVMSVDPGFGGQAFLPRTVEKVRRLRETIVARGLEVEISVDGGIGIPEAAALAAVGAETLVAGTTFFKAADAAAIVRAFRDAGGGRS